MIRPGVSSYAFGWAVNAGGFTPEMLLDFAVTQDLRVIQFGDHLPLHKLTRVALDSLGASAKKMGVEIETGARGLTREHLETYVAISEILGARLLRFVIDGSGYKPSLNEVAEIVRCALPRLRQAGVTLGIENHDRIPCTALRKLVDKIGDEHVGICLDTANSLGAGEGIGEALECLSPVCVNLHVKDFAITRLPYLMGFTVTGRPLGEGMLPLHAVLSTVSRYKRCRTAVVETWPPPEPEPPRTLEKEREWAVRSIRVLSEALKTLGLPNSN